MVMLIPHTQYIIITQIVNTNHCHDSILCSSFYYIIRSVVGGDHSAPLSVPMWYF